MPPCHVTGCPVYNSCLGRLALPDRVPDRQQLGVDIRIALGQLVQVSLVDLEANVGLVLDDLQVFDVNTLADCFPVEEHTFQLLDRAFDLGWTVLPLCLASVPALRVADRDFFRELIFVMFTGPRSADVASGFEGFYLAHSLARTNPRFASDGGD